MPLASPSVGRAFSATPFSFALRDLRLEPSAVGVLQNDDNLVVHTSDNVGQYCTDRLADMLSKAGARINLGMPGAAIEAELLEYKVIEGGRFHGSAKLRLIVRRGGDEPWTKTYAGSSKHWGRTHDPNKFNDVLSNALQDATSKIVEDEEFARALMGEPPAPFQQPEQRRPGG